MGKTLHIGAEGAKDKGGNMLGRRDRKCLFT